MAWRLLIVLAGVALAVAAWKLRGPVVGVVGSAAYGVGFSLALLDGKRTLRWLGAHPVLDALLRAPYVFVAVACFTGLPLATCALIGGAVSLIALPLLVRRASAAASA